jgi:1-aminocyclopropane-1-carboxylate deaminase/D-cysteine desulfhydrase-like pyridoxal-dependent ACC family enzyme
MMNDRIDELMPVEEHAGVLFKRDDLYRPFDDLPVSGGKIRQCLALVLRRLDEIRRDYDSTIATAASVHSPQAAIVARIAKEFDLRCIIGHGAKRPLDHKAMRECADFGAELVQLTTANSYNTVLYGKLAELQKSRNFFTINFGYNQQTDAHAIIDTVAQQARNLPSDMRSLIINVGSGVSANAILCGVDYHWRGDVFKLDVHLIQPFGYRRRTRGLICHSFDYWEGDYDYAKRLQLKVGDIELDEIYESKAFDYAEQHLFGRLIDDARKCVFWLIGNSNGLR